MALAPQEPRSGAESSDSGKAARGGPVLLDDRYRLEPGSPLISLDTPSAKAYEVEDLRDATRKLFALICTPGLPPRANAMAVLRGSTGEGMLPLVEWAAVYWPPLERHCMAVIYERPMGGKFAESFTSAGAKLGDTHLLDQLLKPLLVALERLHSRTFPHRAIRPNNLLYMDAEKKNLVLGDCVTTPPGFDQPTVFETIERGMASPGGRGNGGVADDIYALGVTITYMMAGHNPVGDLTDDHLIDAKLLHGSYAVLCGKERIAPEVDDLLRGMLNDDPGERWGLEDLNKWVSGRPVSAPKKKPQRQAKANVTFDAREYSNVRTLARAFCRSPDEATKAIKDGRLELWLRRDFKKTELADAVTTAVEVAKGQSPDQEGPDDYLVSKICIFLDKAAPIRYRGFSFMPEAYGPALAAEVLRQGDPRIPVEAILRDVPSLWFAAQDEFVPSHPGVAKNLGEIRGYLQRSDIGYGVERCLYELNPSLPCQSALLVTDYVATIGDLMPALEEASKHQDTKTRPMDRQMAAFIAARFSQDIGPHLAALADRDKERSAIGMLSLLALLQWRMEEGTLPGLSAWVGRHLGPAISSYHSRTTRRELERDAPRMVRDGSLPDLFDLIENAQKRKTDEDGYAAAIGEYSDLSEEIDDIENNEEARIVSATLMGQQTASMSSLVLTMVIITILFLNYSW